MSYRSISPTWQCPGKRWWGELLGTSGQMAVSTIEKQNKSVRAVIVRDGSPVTQDFRCDRVRVFVDSDGIVVKIPVIG